MSEQRTSKQEVIPPVYLGDAVYASFDGGRIYLHLNDHRNKPIVVLEPEVYEELQNYAERIWGERL